MGIASAHYHVTGLGKRVNGCERRLDSGVAVEEMRLTVSSGAVKAFLPEADLWSVLVLGLSSLCVHN